jgi:hypothetical protein
VRVGPVASLNAVQGRRHALLPIATASFFNRISRIPVVLRPGSERTVAELADTERINRSYVCRVLQLTLRAPDIVERILDGRPTAGLAQLMKPFPVEWERQRQNSAARNYKAMQVETDSWRLRVVLPV